MKNEWGQLIKSDNALEAEEAGYRTYSRLSAWQKRAVDAGAVTPREWHHTSAAANKTWYYAPEDFEHLQPVAFPVPKATRVTQPDLRRLRATCSWSLQVGGFTRRARPVFESYEQVGLPVTRKDGTIYAFQCPSQTKRLDASGTRIVLEYLPPNCRNWRPVSFEQAQQLGYVFDTLRTTSPASPTLPPMPVTQPSPPQVPTLGR